MSGTPNSFKSNNGQGFIPRYSGGICDLNLSRLGHENVMEMIPFSPSAKKARIEEVKRYLDSLPEISDSSA
ncbi:hypothetical protein N9L18_00020 [Candidatus Pacebacteria bacterium]|nr:hypothetical protein [Candidatus Paceibacterota bacterium]